MLAYFLLDMGLLTAHNMGKIKGGVTVAVGYGVGMSPCNTALLMVLAASASYVAVPSVVRQAIPKAYPSLYFGMSLGLTFPLNILLGIPLYVHIASQCV
jgi:uncharacterized protein